MARNTRPVTVTLRAKDLRVLELLMSAAEDAAEMARDHALDSLAAAQARADAAEVGRLTKSAQSWRRAEAKARSFRLMLHVASVDAVHGMDDSPLFDMTKGLV